MAASSQMDLALTSQLQKNLGEPEMGRTLNNCSPWAMRVCRPCSLPPARIQRQIQHMFSPTRNLSEIRVYISHDMIACFLGAAQLMARNQKKTDQAEAAKVHVSVSFGEPKDLGGFGLAVDIKVEGIDEEVLKAAHEVRSRYVSYTLPWGRPDLFCV